MIDVASWGEPLGGVVAVERELARRRRLALFDAEGSPERGGFAAKSARRSAHAREQAHSVARAAVLNLIVVATRDVHAQRAARISAELATRHPSRAIVILSDRDPSAAAPSITLHCSAQPSDGDRLAPFDAEASGSRDGSPAKSAGRRLTYEQILVRARGPVEERIASAVIPLVLPDLPVFLWWTETPPIGSRRFEELLALADRLLVDSADFPRPAETLAALWRACVRSEGQGVTDFNWTRLTPWRELVTQFFDVPAWRPFLAGVRGVRASFGVDADGRDIHPSQALLFIGWLASRLGWQTAEKMAPSEAGGLLFEMRRVDGASIWTRVRPRFERGIAEGDLSGVRIQAELDGRAADFHIRKTPDARHATTTVIIDGATVLERVVLLPPSNVAQLLGEELTIMAADAVYEDALAALEALA